MNFFDIEPNLRYFQRDFALFLVGKTIGLGLNMIPWRQS